MGSSGGFAKQGLDFAPHHFDGIEIRGIRWQEESLSARLGNELEGLLVFVWRQVVHDDDVAWAKEGEEDIVHISLEDTGVGWAFDGHCGGGSVKAHGSENGGGAPMSMGTGKAQASAFGTAPAQTRHIRLGCRLIEEDKTRGVEARLATFPEASFFGDIGAALLAGVERLFLYASPMRMRA